MSTTTTETFATRLGTMRAEWENGRLLQLNFAPDLRPDSGQPSPFARRVEAHFQGGKDDFKDVPLQLEQLRPFAQKVYQAAREIPPGAALTYGELARKLDSPGAARAVGTALGRNPFLLIMPCHRIVGATGKGGGFSAPGGVVTKRLMLAAEGYGVESLWDSGELERGYEKLLGDPRLGPLVEKVGPCPLKPLYPDDPFAALARNVLYQQLAGSAARAIEARVKALGSAPFPSPDQLLKLSPARLREAGLSRAKVAALHALSTAVLQGVLKVDELRLLPDEQVVEEVSKVKGLGPWSAEMFLLFHLGRRDLLPVRDLGIRKGFQKLFSSPELPSRARMERWSSPWRPYRSLACWYLWRSLEL